MTAASEARRARRRRRRLNAAIVGTIGLGCAAIIAAAADSAPAVRAVKASHPPPAAPADAIPPPASVFDLTDVTPWDPGKESLLPPPVTVERPEFTPPTGAPAAPRERRENPTPAVSDPPEVPASTRPPAPTQPPAPAPTPPPAPAQPPPPVVPGLSELVNRDRMAAGCGPVAIHAALTRQAQAHSDRQASDDSMYHSAGVTGFGSWGENVAVGYETAAAVHNAWMNSPGHRANILNCGYTLIGFGVTDGPSGRYWTEMFAA